MNLETTISLIRKRVSENPLNAYFIEENVRSQLVSTLFGSLGYDITDPLEFLFEYTAGFKKNERVDCAILKNSNPILIIEVKNINEVLKNHVKQLQGYFNSYPTVKLAILTNMKEIQVYSDLSLSNVMDDEPIYTIVIDKVTEKDIEFLQLLSKKSLYEHFEKVYEKISYYKKWIDKGKIAKVFEQFSKEEGIPIPNDLIEEFIKKLEERSFSFDLEIRKEDNANSNSVLSTYLKGDYLKISEIAKKLDKHNNTIDGWFKKLEEEGIHFLNRFNGEKIYDELDLSIGQYIGKKREANVPVNVIIRSVPKSFEVRTLSKDLCDLISTHSVSSPVKAS